MKENWRKIEQYNIEVSNIGRIKNNGKIVKLIRKNDYYIYLNVNVGEWVAFAFLNFERNINTIEYKNGKTIDNRIENIIIK